MPQTANENINLRLFKDSQNNDLYVEIEIRGIIGPNNKSKGRVYLKEDKLAYKVMTIAGALAEHQNEQLGEFHDPDKCAHAAKNAYYNLKKNLEAKNVRVLPEFEYIG